VFRTTFDQRVVEKSKARIERYLPLVLDTISTWANAQPLQTFFLFLHRAMPVCTPSPPPTKPLWNAGTGMHLTCLSFHTGPVRDDLKALVVDKCYRLLRSAGARPQSPGDSYCAVFGPFPASSVQT
jgi:hypothetical protein